MKNPKQLARHRPQGDPESGIVLLMVIFLTFLILLALAVAAPEWAKSFQRQKDLETIHRGQQYERAIQLYYRQFHRYPNTIKQLENTNNVRFLRQKYTDPLTGKDDWKLVLYGHAHIHPLGLFGKPLSDLGAIQSSGGMYAVTGSSSSSASAPTVAGSAGNGNMDSGSPTGSPLGSSMGSSMGGSMGSSMGGTSLGNSPSPGLNSTSSLGSPTSSGSGFKTNAPFVGVVPPVKKHSIVNYRAQDNYDRWEFNYDPIVDELRAKVSILGGSQSDLNGASSLNHSKNSNKSPGGSKSLFGGSNGFGSNSPTSNSGTTTNPGPAPNSTGSDSSTPQ